jgi:hypothetical protein
MRACERCDVQGRCDLLRHVGGVRAVLGPMLSLTEIEDSDNARRPSRLGPMSRSDHDPAELDIQYAAHSFINSRRFAKASDRR